MGKIKSNLDNAEKMMNRAVYEFGRGQKKYAACLFRIAAVFLDRARAEVNSYGEKYAYKTTD